MLHYLESEEVVDDDRMDFSGFLLKLVSRNKSKIRKTVELRAVIIGTWKVAINQYECICVTTTSVFVAFAQYRMLKACLYCFVNDQLSLQIVLQ